MRHKLVAGNWKMYGSRAFTRELVGGLAAEFGSGAPCEIAVCPPFPYLAEAAALVAGSPLHLGAQDVSGQDEGAYTGEVSGAMLADLGCRFAIVGHSERRAMHGETDEVVAAKFIAAQRHGLVPILCVGESIGEREAGQTEAVVGRQLAAVVGAAGIDAFAGAVVAYEPIWAIGTGRTASSAQAEEMCGFIRDLMGRMYGENAACGVRILYGGSVKPDNIGELMGMDNIDGALVGGASLSAADFTALMNVGTE